MAQMLQWDEYKLQNLTELTSPPLEGPLFTPTEDEKKFLALWKEVFDWATQQRNEAKRSLFIYRIKINLNRLKYAGIPTCSDDFLAQLSNQAVLSLGKFLNTFQDTFFQRRLL